MLSNKKRIVYLDVLRVIACLSVIMIHTSAGYVVKDFGTFNFWVGNLFDGIARIGVPLFVMISGSLMLDKNYDYSNKKLIKHIKKLIIFFVFWSALYSTIYQILMPVFLKHESISILKLLGSFIKGHFHLWFIYMIIGLYLILPLLRLWVNDTNIKYVKYFIILAIIFTFIIPQIISIGSNYSNLFDQIQKILDNINIKYVGGFTTYFLLGWYLNNYKIKNKKILYILGILSIALIILVTGILSITTNKDVQMYGNMTVTVLIYSVMIFAFVKDKCPNASENNKIISNISKNSLGIYAIHPLIITIIYKILSIFDLNTAIINIPICFIATILIAYVVAYIFSKIPILNKVV